MTHTQINLHYPHQSYLLQLFNETAFTKPVVNTKQFHFERNGICSTLCKCQTVQFFERNSTCTTLWEKVCTLKFNMQSFSHSNYIA